MTKSAYQTSSKTSSNKKTSSACVVSGACALSFALTLSFLAFVPAQAQKAKDFEKYFRNPTSVTGKTVLVPAGSHFEGRLNDTISSHSPLGQRFSIEITSPVLANSTDVIIPSGAKIVGEVVEAISSDKQPKMPGGKYHPLGKLRVQINILQMPDGVSHPLIASLAGENYQIRSSVRPNDKIHSPNMGYVGTDSQFNAVNPNFDKRKSYMSGPKVTGRRGFFRDPILGNDEAYGRRPSGTPLFRSMRKKGRDVYIYEGSPMTVKLDAPLRLGIAPAKGKLSIDIGPLQPAYVNPEGGIRRFRPESEQELNPVDDNMAGGSERSSRRRASVEEQEPQELQAPDPEGDLPNFLRKSKSEKFRESLKTPKERPANPAPAGNPGQEGGGANGAPGTGAGDF